MDGRISQRVYGLLLHTVPHDFRAEYGTEMAAIFRRRAGDENLAFLWLEIIADIASTATKEHLHMLRQDLVYTLRTLRRAPIFTFAAILTLALGIGANTTVFSVVNAVMLRPFPYREPDRLVRLWETKQKIPFFSISVPNYISWKEQSRSFEALGAFGGASLNLTGTGEPERLSAGTLTASVIPMLGLHPLLGRGFLPEEEQPGGARVALLSESLWRRRFGRNAGVVGQSIELNGAKAEIVGIAPSELSLPGKAEIWIPLQIDLAHENRSNHVISVIGRLKSGVSLQQAEAELKAIAAGLEHSYPASNQGWTVRMASFFEWIVPDRIRTALLVLLGAVSLVMLVACINFANLLLARAMARSREIAIRLALGASRRRIARQLLTESGVIALLGGVSGAALAYGGVQIVRPLLADFIPRSNGIEVDAVVLVFAVGISVLTGLLFGLVPVHQTLSGNQNATLREGGRTATSGRQALRKTLVIVEICMATMLVIGASMLLESFGRLQRARVGFQPERLLTAQISLPRAKYPEKTGAAFYDSLLEQLRSSPGVIGAAISSGVPMGAGDYTGMSARAPRSTTPVPSELTPADWRVVSADYFKTMGIPLLHGRYFGPEDQGDKVNSIIISASLARKLYGDEKADGKEFELEIRERFVVVGVVGDVRLFSLEQDPLPAMYFPAPRALWPNMTVVVRMTGDPGPAAGLLRGIVKRIDPLQPIYNVRTMEQWIDESSAQAKSYSLLLTLFASVALILAMIGVYGVLAYSVTQRTNEFGVRIALGARGRDILGLVLRQGMLLVSVGLVAGIAGALVLQRLVATILFEFSPNAPSSFAVVPVCLGVVSLIACAVPAWRAHRIDPLSALRQE